MHKTTSRSTNFFLKINRTNKLNYPFFILLSIIAYEVMKINLQMIFKEMHGTIALFDNTWTLSSVFGSTLLGFFSDRFIRFSWRKPVCLIGIFCLFITGLALSYPIPHLSGNKTFVLFLVLLNGLSGSYLGAARAFYLDQFQNRKIFYFGITVISQCIPWMLIGFLLDFQIIGNTFLHFFSVGIVFVALICNFFFTIDKRAPAFESRHGEYEVKKIAFEYNHRKYWLIIFSFFILSVSYHLMPYLGEYSFSETTFYQEIALLGLGLIIGVPIGFALIKISTIRALTLGYGVCFLYFVSLELLYSNHSMVIQKSLNYQFLIFAIFGGVLWILSLKEFLLKSNFTENGLVLGFVESIQSLGEFTGASLSTVLSSSLYLQKQFSIYFFIVLLAIALITISSEWLLELFKKDRK